MKSEATITKGQGIEKDYYESGKLKRETPYSYYPDSINGIDKGYFENGKLEYLATYTRGTAIGIHKNFYENGKIRDEWNFTKDTSWCVKYYDEDGNLTDIGRLKR